MNEIYFDNAATTRAYDEVIALVAHTMGDGFGNASSLHRRGVNAAVAINEAAARVGALVGGGEWKVVFTSGGTEADNLAVLGTAPKGKRNEVVITSLEHAAVEEACDSLGRKGVVKVTVNPGEGGVVRPADVVAALTPQTVLISIVHVASEMCTVQPVADIARAAKRANPRARIHVDAVQAAAGLSRLDYPAEVDMVTVSSHKIGGPQGVGALLLRPRVSVRPVLFGGDQQDGLRPGTFNLPGIVGMGLAAQITNENRATNTARLQELTSMLSGRICEVGVRPLGDPVARAPSLLAVAVEGVKSEVLLHTMEKYGLYVASSSACHASRSEPPACLVDAGLKPGEGVVRFSLGRDATADMVDGAALIFKKAVHEVRTGTAGGMS